MTAQNYQISAVFIYLCIVFFVGFLSYRRNLTATDFIIGDRSLNYWLTALAAHASDMSNWLFMGYPSVIFLRGMPSAWTAIGLLIFMFLNWQIVAPKIRIATEQYNSLTFSSFFESRLADTSGLIRVFTAVMSFIFYTIYISAGLVGMGLLTETLFNIHYNFGISIGILIVIPYVFFGGYRTLAWIDLFQGLFLMCVVIFVPLYLLPKIGGIAGMMASIEAKGLPTSLIPDFSGLSLLEIFFIATGWGLGYFGQPHIVTKFMGIKNVQEINKSKWIGMSWMVLSLSAATLVGLVGIAFFSTGKLDDPQQVFIEMVKLTFHPMIIGFMLCAVVAATINNMSSQVLVLCSSITEDFYKRIFHKNASSKELLLVSRLGVLLVSAVAYLIAYQELSTIYSLVFYAWSGLGSAFGPLLIASLYSTRVNKYGAWAGILVGGIVSGVWPFINPYFTLEIPSMIMGFSTSMIAIFLVSSLTRQDRAKIQNISS
ncbi:MAG: sodium/proline symporter [Chlamydiae bacterium]|nr:sodium/proline symporter [Chlamydiota bacterium]